MTRISSFQQSQSLLSEMLATQKKVADAQRQVSTGHVAEFYKDIHMDVTSLAGGKSLLSRLDQHQARAAEERATIRDQEQLSPVTLNVP